ncbi:hypothetical protein [Paraburkholderia humisilvae]|uniref:Uncharacterized protein n=1 Tax=Paraburkholderia humisilvae TaxID=627669 RepID=A0A6J5DJU0_9BURK|nr:hypothetical protein [Paraburkholderia humisilvae]CAB3754213.1 hypothetical protein LMG29542_02280 [Paraburkholderia humisilvae]
MNHVLHNISPRGVARRVALGRWDYSTRHILGLRFTINFLGQGFALKQAPAGFLSGRRWVLTRDTSQKRFSQIVEISVGASGLHASGYAVYPGGWVGEVYAKDIHVPDDDIATTRLGGDSNARVVLDKMKAHMETLVASHIPAGTRR